MTNIKSIYNNILLNQQKYFIFLKDQDELVFTFDDTLFIDDTLNYYIYELYKICENHTNKNIRNIILTKETFNTSIKNTTKYKIFILNILQDILFTIEQYLLNGNPQCNTHCL
jgi:hypothetical protein|tara:strand:- start:1161 stop:1499 length:339 start_codon:yes stop_codon:yes gene_type:complete